jgi:uncharacterized protein YbjQ (UPF0145 family)
VVLAALMGLGCRGSLERVIFPAPPDPPEFRTLRTDEAPALPMTPEDRVHVIAGPLDEHTHEPLGLVVVLLHGPGQFQTDAWLELRKGAASLGADAVAEVRVAPEGLYGVAARARPEGASEAAAQAMPLYAGNTPGSEPLAFVAACKRLPLESAAETMKTSAASLGATAVVGVRVTVDADLPCEGSPLEMGPFARISGLAVRQR